MPVGYLVQLGDGELDVSDNITGSAVNFATDTVLGTGDWVFTGVRSGVSFTDQVESGSYFLATNGHVYFVPDNGILDSLTSAAVDDAPSFDQTIFGTSGNDSNISGTAGDDVMYGGADTSPSGTGRDTMFGRDGDDQIFGGNGRDTIEGGGGDDTIDGGGGRDTIYGDSQTPPTATSEFLDWSAEGSDEDSISGGFTQNTGTMDVTVTFIDEGNQTGVSVESSATQYTETGEPFDANSSVQISGSGLGATTTTVIAFTPEDGSDLSNEVENISFRINDIDSGGWEDIVTINAYDADGNPVTVTMTAAGNDTVSGQTVTAGAGGDSSNEAAGSVLVEIDGPAHFIEILYSNGNSGGQTFFVTDVHFDTIVPEEGDDLIRGGGGVDTIFGQGGDDTIFGDGGADVIDGGTGDDTIHAGRNDTIQGGDGDDTFVFDTNQLNGTGTITITGGEGDETAGDTLDFGGLLDKGSIVYSNEDDDAGGLSGTATLTDGTTVNFSEIETIICFRAGTRILTPAGERRVETLGTGDMVLTRDSGIQPLRWTGASRVSGAKALAPVHIPKGIFGAGSELWVSPQHRMLYAGPMAQWLFGTSEVFVTAQHLVDAGALATAPEAVTQYCHLLLDRHEILFANGAPSESFFPGQSGLEAMDLRARTKLFETCPDLATTPESFGRTARRCLKAHEARMLAEADPNLLIRRLAVA